MAGPVVLFGIARAAITAGAGATTAACLEDEDSDKLDDDDDDEEGDDDDDDDEDDDDDAAKRFFSFPPPPLLLSPSALAKTTRAKGTMAAQERCAHFCSATTADSDTHGRHSRSGWSHR